MANIKVNILNRSTVVTDDEVSAAVPALQTQVHRDFAPPWGIDADLIFVPKTKKPDPKSWWLVVLDNSDQAGALGYHDVTTTGLPIGKVFAGTDKQYGNQWTVTASHELLEILGDPEINLNVFVQNANTTGRLYAYEAADACEADGDGYQINGVLVSDFVFPAWFESSSPKGTQFDYRKLIKNPFDLRPGGYIGYFDISSGSGWQQLSPQKDKASYASRPHVGSRRERRRTPRNLWMSSTATAAGTASAAPSRDEIKPQVIGILSRVANSNSLPITDEAAELTGALGIMDTGKANLAPSFSKISRDKYNGLTVSRADSQKCATVGDTITLVFKRSNNIAT